MEEFFKTGAVASHDALEPSASKKARMHVLGPSDVSQDTDCNPMQPVLKSFPELDGRKFQSSWYRSNPWLETPKRTMLSTASPVVISLTQAFPSFVMGECRTSKKGRTKSRIIAAVVHTY